MAEATQIGTKSNQTPIVSRWMTGLLGRHTGVAKGACVCVCVCVCGVGCGVWGVGCGVWGVGCGVWVWVWVWVWVCVCVCFFPTLLFGMVAHAASAGLVDGPLRGLDPVHKKKIKKKEMSKHAVAQKLVRSISSEGET